MASGRFFLHPAGGAPAPNQCCICGTPDRELVDFRAHQLQVQTSDNGVEYLKTGAVLMCVSCLDNLIADLLPHWVPRTELEINEADLERARVRESRYSVAVEQLNANIASAYSGFVDFLNSPVEEPEAGQDNLFDIFGDEAPDTATNKRLSKTT